jgi:MFS family permease
MTTTSKPVLDLGTEDRRWWFQHLNGYHWFVLIVCALGWMFDCADQQIFTASRSIAMRDLMPGATMAAQNSAGAKATTLFMLGWATGGLIFGMIGDKWGRAKTMALTVFLYAACTGLSALAHSWTEFAMSRLVTGFGVGGEFAAGAALVADVMPRPARAQALGVLQALSAVGNVVGAGMLGVSATLANGNEHLSWRYLYWFGAAPALIAVLVMTKMKEPQRWVEAKAAAAAAGQQNFGRFSDLFTDARWRRNALVGVSLAISGVIGLWGIGFYSPELIDASIPQMSAQTGQHIQAVVAAPDSTSRARLVAGFDQDDQSAYRRLLKLTEGKGDVVPADVSTASITPARQLKLSNMLAKRMTAGAAAKLKSNALMLQQIGAFLGMLTFAFLATRIGRKPTFVIGFFAAWISIFVVYLGFHEAHQIYFMYPFLGFCTLLPFGGYAIYFPELFPTRLRTTGTGFCYNVGRYVASLGPLVFGALGASLEGVFDVPAFRAAAVIVAVVYLVGMIAAFLGPETMGQPLPEDQAVPAH